MPKEKHGMNHACGSRSECNVCKPKGKHKEIKVENRVLQKEYSREEMHPFRGSQAAHVVEGSYNCVRVERKAMVQGQV
jgi:hypothetical protein